jgi:hypothetical protein
MLEAKIPQSRRSSSAMVMATGRKIDVERLGSSEQAEYVEEVRDPLTPLSGN